MSKCIKCGAVLPATGECSSCSRGASAAPKVPSILDRELRSSGPPGNEAAPTWALQPNPLEIKSRIATPGPGATADLKSSLGQVASPARPPPTVQPANRSLPPPLPSHSSPQSPIRAHRVPPAPPPAPVAPKPKPPPVPAAALRKTPAPVPTHSPTPTQLWDETKTQIQDTPEVFKTELRATPAGFWRRCVAWIIDALIVTSLASAYLALAAVIVGIKPPRMQFSGLDALVERLHTLQPILLPGAFLTAVLAVVYTVLFAMLWNGRTPGRLVSGIRLVDRTGFPPGPVRATIRGILSVFSFAFFLGGFWLALFDRRGQTLHDKLTCTFVVKPV